VKRKSNRDDENTYFGLSGSKTCEKTQRRCLGRANVTFGRVIETKGGGVRTKKKKATIIVEKKKSKVPGEKKAPRMSL